MEQGRLTVPIEEGAAMLGVVISRKALEELLNGEAAVRELRLVERS